jgi:GTP-binding protein Era
MAERCGAIAIVGRPNVGKSTLLNRLVGSKLSITSGKPQTTRHAIRGILTQEGAQFVFVDTPGFQLRHGGALNRALNRNVSRALEEVDVVVLVVAAGSVTDEDRRAYAQIPRQLPLIVVINKADTLERRDDVLPLMAKAAAAFPNAEIVPCSARTGRNLADLLATIRARLPEQPFMFAPDELTDRDERFLAAEMIREKLFRTLGEEVPYGAVVEVDSFKTEGKLRRIGATIYVEKDNHKGIVVGANGEKLKSIASASRKDMEALFGGRVFLDVWVKARPGWSRSARDLRRFGLQ